MLKKKAFRKIIITTSSLLILLMVYMIPTTNQTEEVKATSLEIEYITGLGNNNIYLFNDNNFLVKHAIILDGASLKNKIKNILNELTICDCNYLPDGLYATIPKDTEINNIEINKDVATIDFSKEILNQNKYLTDKMIESIVYSITDLEEIEKVIIKIEGKQLDNINDVDISGELSRNIGINKTYEVRSRDNIDNIVIYYIDEIDNNSYYVPVTKYLNLTKEKVEVIIESLANEYIYESNLISKVNQNTKLLNHSLEGYTMILNFNDSILNKEKTIDNDVINTICFSIFDNYDINEIIFKVNDKEILKKSIKDIE
ncbi:MAG: GerMN domain-containing protein [Bacilli bacterium]